MKILILILDMIWMDGWISMIYRYEETRLEIQDVERNKYYYSSGLL